jgi:hypothetical protein
MRSDFALEAAAIAAYESFVRNQQHGARQHVQYQDWMGLEDDDRRHWRNSIMKMLNELVA